MVQLDYEREPVLKVAFYKSSSGFEPTRAWLRSLPKEQRTLIGDDIAIVQYKWPVGMPLVRYLDGSIWELRTILKDEKARVLFVAKSGKMVLLHGFIKKSRKTPKKELRLAQSRLAEIERKNQ